MNDGLSLGKQLHCARLISGLTQEKAAKIIGCDESSVAWIERGKRKPMPETEEKIEGFVEEVMLEFLGRVLK